MFFGIIVEMHSQSEQYVIVFYLRYSDPHLKGEVKMKKTLLSVALLVAVPFAVNPAVAAIGH